MQEKELLMKRMDRGAHLRMVHGLANHGFLRCGLSPKLNSNFKMIRVSSLFPVYSGTCIFEEPPFPKPWFRPRIVGRQLRTVVPHEALHMPITDKNNRIDSLGKRSPAVKYASLIWQLHYLREQQCGIRIP
eukprot:4193708-Amphidinium_carterae.1